MKEKIIQASNKAMIIFAIVMFLIIIVLSTLSGEPFLRTALLVIFLSLIRVPGLMVANAGKERKPTTFSRRARRAKLLRSH
ncbi:hypothetical protein D4R99_02410 [bacterium]|nr:MAG: hypothetical protein D4R99_02410 [bacterium]